MQEPLAQLAEHLTFNQRVGGSNPPWLTNLLINEAVFIDLFDKAVFFCMQFLSTVVYIVRKRTARLGSYKIII
jgi:hypothetical protein